MLNISVISALHTSIVNNFRDQAGLDWLKKDPASWIYVQAEVVQIHRSSQL